MRHDTRELARSNRPKKLASANQSTHPDPHKDPCNNPSPGSGAVSDRSLETTSVSAISTPIEDLLPAGDIPLVCKPMRKGVVKSSFEL